MRSLLLLPVVLAMLCGPARADSATYALVNDDGTLLVHERIVHLYGIYIPDSGKLCRTTIRPVRCGTEASLALRFRIQSFVRCIEHARFADGSVSATCFVKGQGSVLRPDEDLGAYLLSEGLAVAAPDAPFEYVTIERIARAQGRGVWSDRIRNIE